MPPVEKLVDQVRESPRYRSVDSALVRSLTEDEMRRGRSEKELVKAVRNRLHQSVTAYFTGRPRYEQWTMNLEEAKKAGEAAFKDSALALMRAHASTSERLPVFAEFCRTMKKLGRVSSVLDLGCGLAPLGALWWLSDGARYAAVDACADLAGFLDRFLSIAGIPGRAHSANLLSFDPKGEEFDVAVLLKVIPLLAQFDAAAPRELLARINARRFVISFPLRSLGGRNVGMEKNYSRYLEDFSRECGITGEKITLGNELFYLAERVS